MLWKIRTDICLCLGVTFLSPNRSSVKQRIALHAKSFHNIESFIQGHNSGSKIYPFPKKRTDNFATKPRRPEKSLHFN